MRSSAVVVLSISVIGGRTNTEGRESTSAAMLTGKIPIGASIAMNSVTAPMPSRSRFDRDRPGLGMLAISSAAR